MMRVALQIAHLCTSLQPMIAYVSLYAMYPDSLCLHFILPSSWALLFRSAFVRPLHIWHYVPQALQRSLGHVKDAEELYPFEGRAAWLIQL